MAFEEYIPKRIILRQPAVSISKTGLVTFNSNSVNNYIADEYKKMKVYYDKDTNRIGLKLFKENVENSITISRSKSRSMCSVSLKSFLILHEILPSKSMRAIPLEYDSVLEMLIIKIDKNLL